MDWDAAFQADRYVDLATLANWFTRDEAGEAALLATYSAAPTLRNGRGSTSCAW